VDKALYIYTKLHKNGQSSTTSFQKILFCKSDHLNIYLNNYHIYI
jgi:hypothetical protein